MDNIAVTKILLLLKSIPELGTSKIIKILSFFNTPEKLLAITSSNIDVLKNFGLTSFQIDKIIKPNWGYANKQIAFAQKSNIEIINIYDNYYPELLKQIYDPPCILYVKGNKKILSAQLFAIVGTRKPTIYGRNTAAFFSEQLLANGYIVTSGFARGIDITSHLAVAKYSQPTVVVLGTSLDCIYPAEHKKYIQQILDGNGVIISENGFTTSPHASVFPKRNRIISGLSKGVLVVEAARKSGSLITARCAMEQSREVFAVPGNINNQQALGCLDLIAEGAKLTISIDDILEELTGIIANRLSTYTSSRGLNPGSDSVNRLGDGDKLNNKNIDSSINLSKHNQSSKPLNTNINDSIYSKLSRNQEILLESIAGGVVELDQIVNTSRLTIAEVMAQLVQLEIMGLVASVPGGYVKNC